MDHGNPDAVSAHDLAAAAWTAFAGGETVGIPALNTLTHWQRLAAAEAVVMAAATALSSPTNPLTGAQLARIDRHDEPPGGLTGCRRRRSLPVLIEDFCSWNDLGWRSVLLRRFENAPATDNVYHAPAKDQLLVLVTRGATSIETWSGAKWRKAEYQPGSISMTAPGRETRLRWRTPPRSAFMQLRDV